MANRCLFCLRSDRRFTSAEHILPEGIGNTEFLLPPGVVCDACNNGPLSEADQAFLNFMPVAFMRVTRGVPTKAGRPPETRLANAILRQVDPTNVHAYLHGSRGAREIPGGFQASFTGRRMTAKYTAQVTRFLFKGALEFMHGDLGAAEAFDPKYDEVRRIALGAPYGGFLALTRSAKPHEKVSFMHWPIQIDGKNAIWVQIDVFGVVMGTELLQRIVPSEANGDMVAVIPF